MKKIQLTVKNISSETQLMRNNNWERIKVSKWKTIKINEDKAKIIVKSYPKKYKIIENVSEDNDLLTEISQLKVKISAKDTENAKLRAKIINLEKEINKISEIKQVPNVIPNITTVKTPIPKV